MRPGLRCDPKRSRGIGARTLLCEYSSGDQQSIGFHSAVRVDCRVKLLQTDFRACVRALHTLGGGLLEYVGTKTRIPRSFPSALEGGEPPGTRGTFKHSDIQTSIEGMQR